jgi:hypothetical protein
MVSGIFSGPALSDGAGQGSLSSTAVRYLRPGGMLCSTIWKNYFFKEIYAIIGTKGFGFKNRNFGRFFPGKRTLLACGGQGCGIISEAIKQVGRRL